MKKTVCILLSVLFSAMLFAEKPIVHDISAHPGTNRKINILWTLPQEPDEEITELLIYRSTKQITSYEQIRKEDPIARLLPNTSGYTDSVDDYSEYYYAVIAVTSKPYDLILLSFNSTVLGAHLKIGETKFIPEKNEVEKLYPEGTLREIPLPFIDFNDKDSSTNIVSEEATDAASSLHNIENSNHKILKPYFFEEDLISPDGGDDYLLFDILKTTFVRRKYSEAIVKLEKLTGTNISENTRNRANFYLGEAYYFLGEYDEAIKSFVKVGSVYPTLVQQWLDSALDRS